MTANHFRSKRGAGPKRALPFITAELYHLVNDNDIKLSFIKVKKDQAKPADSHLLRTCWTPVKEGGNWFPSRALVTMHESEFTRKLTMLVTFVHVKILRTATRRVHHARDMNPGPVCVLHHQLAHFESGARVVATSILKKIQWQFRIGSW